MADADDARRGATIYSVADQAGVSIATVSRVLQGSSLVSERTTRKVLDAVAQLDYLPSGAARSLAVRHHDTYGLVLPELSGPYYAELLVGFETRAAELDQSVMLVLAGTKEDRDRAVRTLAGRVDGIAVLGSDAANVGSIGKAGRASSPATPGTASRRSRAENIEGARRLTEHLLGHGRTHLLFVGDPDAAPDILERYDGFVAAHRARGLDRRRPGARRVPRARRHRRRRAACSRATSPPTPWSAPTTSSPWPSWPACSDGGVDVPGDIAVVGWDDVMTARYVRPGLTTVRQPVRELGALAADRLHELVSGARPERRAPGPAHRGGDPRLLRLPTAATPPA